MADLLRNSQRKIVIKYSLSHANVFFLMCSMAIMSQISQFTMQRVKSGANSEFMCFRNSGELDGFAAVFSATYEYKFLNVFYLFIEIPFTASGHNDNRYNTEGRVFFLYPTVALPQLHITMN